MEEKREQGRVRIDRRATIRLSRGLRVVVRTVEISGSGMSFRYEAPAEIGALLEIELGIPAPGGIQAIKVQGKVFHSHLIGNEFHSGIKFVSLGDAERLAILRFIKVKERQRLSSS